MLLQNYFKRQQQIFGHRTVLNLGDQFINFPNATTKYYQSNGAVNVKNVKNVQNVINVKTFKNRSFDFVYGNDQHIIHMLKYPVDIVSKLSRLSTFGGWFDTVSPISIVLQKKPPILDYICWTNMHTNLLCFVPYHGIPKLYHFEQWKHLVTYNPYYLKNIYVWENSLEMNFCLFNPENQEEYEDLFNEGIKLSSEHTKFMVQSYGITRMY